MEWQIKSSSNNVDWSDRCARRNCSNATGGIVLGESLAKSEEELAQQKKSAKADAEVENRRLDAAKADGCSSFGVVIEDLDEHWTACALEIGLTTVVPDDQISAADHDGSSILPEACSFLQPPLWLWTFEGELFDGTRHLKSAKLDGGKKPIFTPDCFRRGDVVTFGWINNTLQLQVNGQLRAFWPGTSKPTEDLYPIVGICGRVKAISIPKEPTYLPYKPNTLGEVVYRGHRAFIHKDKQRVVDQIGILHNSVIEFVASVDSKLSTDAFLRTSSIDAGDPSLEEEKTTKTTRKTRKKTGPILNVLEEQSSYIGNVVEKTDIVDDSSAIMFGS